MGRDDEQWLDCENISGHPAQVLVAIRGDKLTVMLPAPGTGMFGLEEAERLQRLVHEAVIVLRQQRRLR